MNMEDYLKEIEYAATQVLTAIWHEHDELKKIDIGIVRLNNEVWKQFGVELPQGAENAIKVHFAGKPPKRFFSDEEKMLYAEHERAQALRRRILARQYSIDALSGTILQFAKQGISIVHEGLEKCPDGRHLGTQVLKTTIWHARNQSIHWDEKLKAPVSKCFRTLIRDFGMRFAMFNSKSLGFEVVDLMSWRSFEDFKRDMLSLK